MRLVEKMVKENVNELIQRYGIPIVKSDDEAITSVALTLTCFGYHFGNQCELKITADLYCADELFCSLDCEVDCHLCERFSDNTFSVDAENLTFYRVEVVL